MNRIGYAGLVNGDGSNSLPQWGTPQERRLAKLAQQYDAARRLHDNRVASDDVADDDAEADVMAETLMRAESRLVSALRRSGLACIVHAGVAYVDAGGPLALSDASFATVENVPPILRFPASALAAL